MSVGHEAVPIVHVVTAHGDGCLDGNAGGRDHAQADVEQETVMVLKVLAEVGDLESCP